MKNSLKIKGLERSERKRLRLLSEDVLSDFLSNRLESFLDFWGKFAITEDIEDILSRVDALVSWASDIKEYALQQAVSGKEWHGWKLVEGRSNRRYTNEAAVIQTVSDAGFDPYERKLLGITAMQKLLGKARFDELLTAYIEKPQGKPTLVPESDKRPAMNTAKNDFMEENIDE